MNPNSKVKNNERIMKLELKKINEYDFRMNEKKLKPNNYISEKQIK